MIHRYWLPARGDFDSQIASLQSLGIAERWNALLALAKSNLDFASTIRLDRVIGRERRQAAEGAPQSLQRLRLAVLSTSTTSHLTAGLRVAALGRGLLLDVYEPAYGQGWQEIASSTSDLHRFEPQAVLFAQDPYSIVGRESLTSSDPGGEAASAALALQRAQWRRVRELWGTTVIQQVPLNPMPRLMGENERRLPGSMASLLDAYRSQLRQAALEGGVDVVDLEHWAGRGGLAAWHSLALWNRSKQDIHPSATPVYGDLIARLLAARSGRSAKCLVLDLDHTIWGGVIGDDGLEGIVIGQGSAAGEGYLAFQRYAKGLSKRGIVLAVCSKNDDAVARKPFQSHPDMILRLEDIGCFMANWTDKATNLKAIADHLAIGIDTLVFADDNPFERDLIRRELPEVFVPELSDEPAAYATTIADSGYFEAVALTSEDLSRSAQYQSNAQRQALKDHVTDLDGYLMALEMRLKHTPFDAVGVTRIAQLINKTNQFNLTTRRYSESDVGTMLHDRKAVTLQLRLLDRYGDNGVIAIVIAFYDQVTRALDIDSWLMSCRVLGRQVEKATLNIIAEAALDVGARLLTGRYVPTERNGMVRDHYAALGFKLVSESNGVTEWVLALSEYRPMATTIQIEGA